MTQLRWLCSGLASSLIATAGVGVTLSACEGDGESGGASDAGLVDSKPWDSGNDLRDSAPQRNAARLTVVNAAHDLGPSSNIGTSAAVRLCFKEGSVAQNLSVAPYPPLPDRVVATGSSPVPGIYYGAGATFPAVGLDLAGRIIVPIVMSSKSLAGLGLEGLPGQPRTCDQLVGDTADLTVQLAENRDYWVLPAIDPGSLANDKAYVLALTGCVGDATTPNPGKCGIGFMAGRGPGRGNLKLTIYETSRTPVAPLGAQFLYVSTQANAFFSQANAKGSIQPGFVSNAADGGGFRPITDINPPSAKLSEVVAVTNVQEGDSFVFGPTSLNPLEAARGVPLLASSLRAIQQYSGLSSPTGGTVYPNGQNYVLIAVGDPDTGETRPFTKPDGTVGDGGDGSRFNARFFHFLAYPTDPVVEPYSPP